MKRATVYIVILGVVCTGLGVAIGIAIEKRYTARNLPKIVRSHLLQRPEARHLQRKGARLAQKEKARARTGKVFERIERELNLSSEQGDRVKVIFEETKQEVKQARDEFRTQVTELREKSNTQISEVLNPEQKDKFERLMRRSKERREKRGEKGRRAIK